jgi:hypothetical protein
VDANPVALIDPLGLSSLAACYRSPAMMQTCVEAGMISGSRAINRGITVYNILDDLGIDTDFTDDAQGALDIDADEACPPGDGKDPCKKLRKRLKEHQQKLREYQSNPLAADNKGTLQSAIDAGNTVLAQKIFSGRMHELAGQIKNFRLLLIACEIRNGLR